MADITPPDDGPIVQSDTGRFAQIPEWVLRLRLPCSTVAVYAALALHADRNGHDGIPSRKTLGEFTGCSVDTVDRAIKALVTAGALVVQSRRRDDGSATSNRYILLRVHPAMRGQVAAPMRPGVAASMRPLEQSQLEHINLTRGSRSADPSCVQCQGRGVKGYAPADDPKAEPAKDVPCDCTLPDYEPRPAPSGPPADWVNPFDKARTP